MFLKRSLFAVMLPLVLVGMLVAACGNNTTTAGAPPAAAPSAPTATPTPVPAPDVMTASATVDGKTVTILTDAKGMTLYYFMPDTATTSACTGTCAKTWPPLLSTAITPTSSTTLPGILGLASNANGTQVQYQNHFLYTFAGDTKAGDTTGQGKAGAWFVATTDLTLLKNPSNGYGY